MATKKKDEKSVNWAEHYAGLMVKAFKERYGVEIDPEMITVDEEKLIGKDPRCTKYLMRLKKMGAIKVVDPETVELEDEPKDEKPEEKPEEKKEEKPKDEKQDKKPKKDEK